MIRFIKGGDYDGLTYRAANVLFNHDINSKEGLREYLKTYPSALSPHSRAHFRNCGRKVSLELMHWANIETPKLELVRRRCQNKGLEDALNAIAHYDGDGMEAYCVVDAMKTIARNALAKQ